MYNYDEALCEDNLSLLIYAGDSLLTSQGWGDFVRLSATGGAMAEGSGILSFELTASVTNDPEETQMEDEFVVTIIDSLLHELAYDFAVERRWIIHTSAALAKESTVINPSSPWAVPTTQ